MERKALFPPGDGTSSAGSFRKCLGKGFHALCIFCLIDDGTLLSNDDHPTSQRLQMMGRVHEVLALFLKLIGSDTEPGQFKLG